MRLDKMTSRLQNALSDAQSLALGKDHSAVETIHLLSVLVEQRDGSVLPMLIRAGGKAEALRGAIAEALTRLPTLGKPTGEISVGQGLARVLNMADRLAQQAGDSYLSTEQVLLAMFGDSTVAGVLKQSGVEEQALKQVVDVTRDRGCATCTTPTPTT